MWLDITCADDGKQRLRWVRDRPIPPLGRIEYRRWLCCFFGPEDEFHLWLAEPLWRRVLGLTEWDRKRGNRSATGGPPR